MIIEALFNVSVNHFNENNNLCSESDITQFSNNCFDPLSTLKSFVDSSILKVDPVSFIKSTFLHEYQLDD